MSARKRILVVDDEESIRKVLERLLKDSGYEVYTAKDGSQALELLQNEPPALVLLDINMPKFGGMRFLEIAKRLCPGIPIIMVTGEMDEAQALDTMGMGAEDYVTKPFDFAYLESSIQANLAASGA